MKTTIQLRAFVEKTAEGALRIVATDETMDRSGESIPFESWDLTNFLKSPRLLIDHDYRVQAIVGKALNVEKDGKRRAVTFEPEFHDITQAARETKEMAEQGYLDTVSVGFLRNGEKNELMEVSFVAVPANPNARMLSVKDIADAEAKAVEAFLEGKDAPADEGTVEKAEGDACTMEDGSDGVLEAQEDGSLVCVMPKVEEAAPQEGDVCTLEEGGEGMMQMGDDGMLVCMAVKAEGGEEAEPEKPVDPVDTEEGKEEAEKGLEADDVKAGRVLSEKNRSVIKTARESMQTGVAALDALLEATEASEGGEGAKASADAPKTKGRAPHAPARDDAFDAFIELRKAARAVSTALSEALKDAKLR